MFAKYGRSTWCELRAVAHTGDLSGVVAADIYPLNGQGVHPSENRELAEFAKSPDQFYHCVSDRLSQIKASRTGVQISECIGTMQSHLDEHYRSFHMALVSACEVVAPELLQKM